MKSDFKVPGYTNNIARENIVMKALIAALQDAGGKLDKKEARNQLPKFDTRIHDDVLWYERPAPKRGGTYIPFTFTISWAARHLALAGYLIDERMKPYVLTDKGLKTDVSKLNGERVRLISQPLLDEIQVEKKKNKESIQKVEKKELKESNDSTTELPDETETWKDQLKAQLGIMDPYQFEKFSRRLIKEMGAEIDDSLGIQKSRDGGIDGYAYFKNEDFRTIRVAIQSKRYNHQVGDNAVRDFRGAIQNGTEYGILLATNYFTDAAKREAKDPSKSTPITLLDIEDIVDLVERYQLFLKRVETYELGSFYFE
ncbi:MAG: restriction endonuclease [Furfurilactobacillus sp.]|jgi:restriction system protein|uniref:restriction endonuclease n=1 Tax=Furfurilactobacillus TaxID=2767882 RepID=UPI001EEE254A|nr:MULTISPECIES: restriction endonuclease [Furfurilactobacillus]MCF6418623.1 restriction endonuclease [Furfurilactobacillus milii]MCH4012085.1 restriction endonuclease [Furfurilactobacillus sp.]MCH4037977.1 restriction endonuclease [Furfurilactobacillus sp.]MCH4115386.1 restriction endonuclease [Furfurilactobacillus sp.]MCI1340607.1 restriction endonuclease [Furfurilactobacillus sp.]